ncbi:PREDICTED: uncharacterized protein LOC106338659 [Brassica oleracea var. oleracea]|uniref:uncharacterized protein LOC106338659 n=1 Tax=Brassica oleracea var. oleracea TaxID=109376 RepID=UPI0006A747FB|nr:PREDICTED: uncharacterized protein LOC106338659 [Brassica oleracea var. oleracea]
MASDVSCASVTKQLARGLLPSRFFFSFSLCFSIDGPVAELPRRCRQRVSVSSSDVKVPSLRSFANGFLCPNRKFRSQMRKMEALHEPTWRKAGFFEAIKASTFKIREDPSLIQALAENWCPETKSLVIPWGEATVTLEDVMVLLGFSVLGFPVFASLESSEMRRAVKRLEKARTKILGNQNNGYRVSQLQWTLRFKDIDDDDSLEHEALEEQKKVNVEVSDQQLAEDKVKRWEALQEISTNKHLLIKIREASEGT